MLMNPEIYVLAAFLIFFGLFGRVIWRALAGMLDGHADVIRVELAEGGASARGSGTNAARGPGFARRGAGRGARGADQQPRRGGAGNPGGLCRRRSAGAAPRTHGAGPDRPPRKKAVITEIQQTAADIAVQAARRVIAETLSPADDAAIVDHAIASLPNALRAA